MKYGFILIKAGAGSMTSISQLKYLWGLRSRFLTCFLSHSVTCILQQDRDSPFTEQAKATGQSIRVFTLEMRRMVLCPRSKEEETRHKCLLWGAIAEFRGKKVQPWVSP